MTADHHDRERYFKPCKNTNLQFTCIERALTVTLTVDHACSTRFTAHHACFAFSVLILKLIVKK